MIPLQIAGLALGGSALIAKYAKDLKPLPGAYKPRIQFIRPPTIKPLQIKPLRIKPLQIKPLQIKPPISSEQIRSVVKGLSTTLSRIGKTITGEDYDAIISGFLPEDSELIIPKFPRRSSKYDFADLDGDSRFELIASYRYPTGVRTIVLKNMNDRWEKISEIDHAGFDSLHFRGAADFTGEGKKQLLLGFDMGEELPELNCYSLNGYQLEKVFSLPYQRFEILESQRSKDRYNNARLAVWEKEEQDTHKIKILQWNGSYLEETKNTSLYYLNRVVPHYALAVKRNPNLPSGWYYLADALANAGLYRDALIAVEIGMEQDTGSKYKEKFSTLRKRIINKA